MPSKSELEIRNFIDLGLEGGIYWRLKNGGGNIFLIKFIRSNLIGYLFDFDKKPIIGHKLLVEKD